MALIFIAEMNSPQDLLINLFGFGEKEGRIYLSSGLLLTVRLDKVSLLRLLWLQRKLH